MTEYRHMEPCFMCRRSFQFGPHLYELSRAWGELFCRDCVVSNHDGIVLARHPKLREHLRKIGAEPVLNAKGWLPWPPGMI